MTTPAASGVLHQLPKPRCQPIGQLLGVDIITGAAERDGDNPTALPATVMDLT